MSNLHYEPSKYWDLHGRHLRKSYHNKIADQCSNHSYYKLRDHSQQPLYKSEIATTVKIEYTPRSREKLDVLIGGSKVDRHSKHAHEIDVKDEFLGHRPQTSSVTPHRYDRDQRETFGNDEVRKYYLERESVSRKPHQPH